MDRFLASQDLVGVYCLWLRPDYGPSHINDLTRAVRKVIRIVSLAVPRRVLRTQIVLRTPYEVPQTSYIETVHLHRTEYLRTELLRAMLNDRGNLDNLNTWCQLKILGLESEDTRRLREISKLVGPR